VNILRRGDHLRVIDERPLGVAWDKSVLSMVEYIRGGRPNGRKTGHRLTLTTGNWHRSSQSPQLSLVLVTVLLSSCRILPPHRARHVGILLKA
jgi:hypothetical protein